MGIAKERKRVREYQPMSAYKPETRKLREEIKSLSVNNTYIHYRIFVLAGYERNKR